MVRLIDGDSVREISAAEANNLLNVWNKQRHIAEINQLHDELFKSILSANGYIDMTELTMWAMQPDSQYRVEANAIKQWYIDTYTLIEQYGATVTEQTAVKPTEFIDNLPKYEA